MSKVEVDQVDPQSGTTLTLGTSGDTVSIPSGVTLANSGTATGFASIAWQSSIVTAATHTAAAGQGLWLDTSSNAITLTLPSSPSVGDELIFTDFARNWGTNAVTLNLNGSKFQGNTSPNPVYDTNGESVNIVYSGSSKGWIPNTDGAVAFETPQTYSASYLVVAGGGSGGKDQGAGGGAGGLLTNVGGAAITLNGGTTYTITVGAGGAARTTAQRGDDGQNSVLSGSDISTVTTLGGGGGGCNSGGQNAGNSGGSGGGGAHNGGSGAPSYPGGSAGTANTGGGGGGSAGSGAGGNGGSGVVFLSMPDAKYSSTTTGSPTVVQNVGGAGRTVITFNASGSYTA